MTLGTIVIEVVGYVVRVSGSVEIVLMAGITFKRRILIASGMA